jgi:hypothetical protein
MCVANLVTVPKKMCPESNKENELDEDVLRLSNSFAL